MTTTDRIKDILGNDFLSNLNEIEKNILKLQLENLVIQAQVEQLAK